jgi:hypothetical protein
LGGGKGICTLAILNNAPVVVTTATAQDEKGSGNLLSSLLLSLTWHVRKHLIKFPGKLLLGREKEFVIGNFFQCL